MSSGFLGGGMIGPRALGGVRLAAPVPVAGAELLVNGGFELNDASWSAINSPVVNERSTDFAYSGTYSRKIVNDADEEGIYQVFSATSGWCIATAKIKSGASIPGRFYLYAGSYTIFSFSLVAGGWHDLVLAGRFSNLNIAYLDTNSRDAWYVDSYSVRPLTLASLLSTRPYASPDCDLSVAITRTAGTQAGLVGRLDSQASPANFIIAYCDGAGSVKCDKCVAGVYTNIITTAVTYVAGATLRMVVSGTTVMVLYNGALIGAAGVADAGIVGNTLHGEFSTYAANTFAGYINTQAAWASAATWTVTTTGAATHTVAAFTVSAATVVDWGDGLAEVFTGAGARTHNYAGAGTWTVRVMQPLNVTALTLSDNQVTLNSSGIACMVNMGLFAMAGVKAGAFNSADVAAWRPATFNINTAPAGYTGTFNSADIAAWRPTSFRLYSMPAGYAGTFNSADVAAWRASTFYMHTMPVATFAITVTEADFSAWTTTTALQMHNNALSEAQVNAILYGLYRAAIAPRTGTGGTINVSGTNAAPSGTYQACASPPVTAATPGKEIAHELINDTIGAFANHWATVTTS